MVDIYKIFDGEILPFINKKPFFNLTINRIKLMKPPIAPRTPKEDKPETFGWDGAD